MCIIVVGNVEEVTMRGGGITRRIGLWTRNLEIPKLVCDERERGGPMNDEHNEAYSLV